MKSVAFCYVEGLPAIVLRALHHGRQNVMSAVTFKRRCTNVTPRTVFVGDIGIFSREYLLASSWGPPSSPPQPSRRLIAITQSSAPFSTPPLKAEFADKVTVVSALC